MICVSLGVSSVFEKMIYFLIYYEEKLDIQDYVLFFYFIKFIPSTCICSAPEMEVKIQQCYV